MTPPVGAGWAYGYTGYDLTSVTTPHGGQVVYAYGLQTVGSSTKWVITRRTAAGRDIPDGNWYFYYHGTDTVVDGDSKQTVYTFSSSIEGPGTVVRREIKWDGATFETEDLSWQTSVRLGEYDDTYDSPPGDPYVALFRSSAITRNGVTYSTVCDYHDADLNDYGQPWRSTETGDFTRTTERTFRHAFPGYIRSKVASVTVTVAGDSVGSVHTYDDNGFLTEQTVAGIRTRYAPTGRGNVASETDDNDHTTSYSYECGVRKDTTTPEFSITQSVNADGTVASITRHGATTALAYDDLGRETRRTPPVGSYWQTDYASDGSYVLVTRGISWTKTYLDGYARTTRTENAVGVQQAFEYDAAGRRTWESLPFVGSASAWVQSEYDALDRVTRRVNPDESDVRFAFSNGVDVTITDEEDRETVQNWAATGTPATSRLVEVTDAAGTTTSYSYNALGKLTGTSGAASGSRTWSYYPGTGLLASETHPESGVTTYHYDGAGRLDYTINAASQRFDFGYDDNNRLTSVTPVGQASHTLTFGYDDADNRIYMANGAISTDLEYDDNHNLTKRTDTIGGRVFVGEFDYDGRDNLISVRYPRTGGLGDRQIRYEYDAANRINEVYQQASTIFARDFSYHANGMVASYTAGNNLVHSLSLVGERGWPDVLNAGNVLNLDYGYDDVGNITSVADTRVGMSQTYVPDVRDRVTSATGVWGTWTFGYDHAGNRDRKTVNGVDTTYSYTNNRLTGSTTGGTVETFVHNSVGAIEADHLGTYAYTPHGMLQQASLFAGLTMTFGYDGDQRRATRQWSGQTRYYLSGPGGQLLSEYRDVGGTLEWIRDDIYIGTRLLASVRASSLTTVTAVSPERGPHLGGTLLTITGSGFLAGQTTVTVGGTAATNVTVTSSTSLTAVTPAHVAGVVDVVVTTEDGSGSKGAAFTFYSVSVMSWLGFDSHPATDLSVYRPTTSEFRLLTSASGFQTPVIQQFGTSGDQPLRGDFDGDGLRDVAVYRPSAGTWFWLQSSTQQMWYLGWGAAGDVPVSGDFDGDGKTDLTVYRPSTGTWFILESHANYTTWSWFGWGNATDTPMPGDYDGDGTSDAAVFRPSTGEWFVRPSNGTPPWTRVFGQAGDIPLPGDFDGDGRHDLVVYRPAAGTWFWVTSSTGFTAGDSRGWGVNNLNDDPVPGDYDGDGKTDPTVFRPGTGQWFILKSTTNWDPGQHVVYTWGVATDIPLGGRR